MKAYKGFDRNMQCRGFQFEEGKTYEEQEAVLCEKGFHACEMPLDCFKYYPPATSEYHEVELEDLGEKKTADDSKVVGKKIKIGAKLTIRDLVDAQIEFAKEHTVKNEGASATGDQGAASATGNRGAASATGNRGAASATGDLGAASATGYRGAASATGEEGIAVASGFEGRVMGSIGNAICACERGNWNGKTYPLLAVKAAIVDGENIKANTWYTLKNGEFVEVKED